MPTYGHPSGAVVAERIGILQVSCDRCETTAFAGHPELIEVAALSFEALGAAPQIASDISIQCPDCGSELTVDRALAGFWPDEENLKPLFWEADLDRSTLGEQRWFLLDAPPFAEEAMGEITLALLRPDRQITLGSDGEDALAREWGRPLSVRSSWRLLLSRVDQEGGAETASPASGITLLAMKMLEDLELTDLLIWIEEKLQSVKKQFPGEGGWVIRLSEGALSPGGYTEWAGPWADKIGEEIAAFSLVDRGLVAEAIERAVSRAELAEADPPANPLPEDSPEAEITSDVFDEDDAPDPDARWYTESGVPFAIAPGSVAGYAGIRATTLDEAAQQVVQTKVMLARMVARAVVHLQSAVTAAGFDAELRIESASRVIVEAGGGKRYGVVNLSNMLAKFDWNPTSDGLTDRIVTILCNLKDLSEQPGSVARSCSCDQQVYLRHLRAASFQAGADPALTQELTDVTGRQFRLFPTVDCPHAVAYLLSPAVEQLREEGANFEELFERGVRLARFSLQAKLLSDSFGARLGVLITGHNVGTVLAHPPLQKRLYGRLRKRLQLRPADPLWAFAVTTDVAIVVREQEEAIERARDAVMELKMREHGLEGSDLLFVAPPESKVSAGGLLEIKWSRESVVGS